MSVTYINVYSPVNGYISGKPDGYCIGGSHPKVCLENPYDIMCSTTGIQFKADSLIKSIRTTYYSSGVCLRGSEIPAPWDAKIRVEFYTSPGGVNKLGSVCYAHVIDPVPNGTYNTNVMVVGYVPSNCPCACNTDSGCRCGGYNSRPEEKGYCANQTGLCSEKCPCRCCYGGLHVHMEADSNGIISGRACSASVTTSSMMYKWESPF